MSQPHESFEDADFLAADYALGTLEGAQWRAAARRLRHDAAFRQEVETWQRHLSPLEAGVEPVAPPPGLWSEIEAALPAAAAGGLSSTPAGESLALRFWRWLALGSSGLAAASLAVLAVLAWPAPNTIDGAPDLAAAIAGEDGLALFTVVMDADAGTVTLVPLRLEAGAGQVPELWLIPEGGVPHSLGVVDASAPLRISLSSQSAALGRGGGTLAISLEPEGGSPTGQPTGPVVGHGALHSI